MRAVKLCSNKIFQFLNWECRLAQVDLCNGCKMVVVVVVVYLLSGGLKETFVYYWSGTDVGELAYREQCRFPPGSVLWLMKTG